MKRLNEAAGYRFYSSLKARCRGHLVVSHDVEPDQNHCRQAAIDAGTKQKHRLRRNERKRMMTLHHALPIAELRRDDIDMAADYPIPNTPMACESVVTDAVRHLFSGFLMVEKIDATSRSRWDSVTLELTSENICTVIKELNHCSIGFWRLPAARISAGTRSREFAVAFKRRRGAPENKCRPDTPADLAVATKPREQVAPEFVTQGRASISKPKWDESLALAILHLVGAYKAMELLSASAFPSGAPDSFELACRCLCTALVTLDTCFAGCAD